MKKRIVLIAKRIAGLFLLLAANSHFSSVLAQVSWNLTGNAGTVPGTHFVGTTDNQPLEIRAGGQRAMLFYPDITGFAGVSVVAGSNTIEAISPAATIAGGQNNLIRSGGYFSTIGGGKDNVLDFNAQQVVIAGGIENRMGANANSSAIGGGWQNVIQSDTGQSVIAGGYTNSIGPSVFVSAIGGGWLNSIETRADYSVIGGGRLNRILATNQYATIAGGIRNEIQTGGLESTIGGGSFHTIASNVQRAFIGGGSSHTIASHYGTIGGGSGHVIDTNAPSAFIGGGSGNRIASGAQYATISGGSGNISSGVGATVGGGSFNTSSGAHATIPGGTLNAAAGTSSFAAGQRASAAHSGSFVWADSSSSSTFASTAANQFLIRAAGGVGIGTATPTKLLHLRGIAPTIGLEDSASAANQAGYVSFRNNSSVETAWVGFGTAGSPTFSVVNARAGGNIELFPFSGRVGVRRTPTANALEVEGNASKSAAGSWLANSDARIKTGVRTVTSALDKLSQVRLVEFHYTDEYRAQHPSLKDRSYLNVVAQEFQKVFPEDVQSSGEKIPGGDDAILQVDTYPLTIYSAAAIQELNQKLAHKETEIAKLEARLEKLERLLDGKGNGGAK